MSADWQRITVVDTHTAGEPTRVVLEGGPDLGLGPLSERRSRFRREFDPFRSAIANEPRGSDVMVGALLVPPVDPACATGVIFFNNVGYLGMCGHGAMGAVVALAHAGKLGPGRYRLETPVGEVQAEYHGAGRVSIQNVASYRYRTRVRVNVPQHGAITGDVAWGGNWFFLSEDHGQALTLARVAQLTAFAQRVKESLASEGITGAEGAEIDHVELFGPPSNAQADSRNFVLCPGGAYDRSPCGTGTSAKLACLAADGKLAPGQLWRQESIVGSLFEGRVQAAGEQWLPTITGSAFVTAQATLLVDPCDPFAWGIRS